MAFKLQSYMLRLTNMIFLLNKFIFSLLLVFTFYMMCFVSSVNAATQVIVDESVTHQRIDGFGGEAGALRDIQNMSAIPQKEVLDLLYDVNNGIGLSIVRVYISHEFELSPDDYDITVQDKDAWLLNEAKKRGVTYYFGRVGSPPAWMKTNNDINNGGSLKVSFYNDFAEFLARWVTDFKSRYNIDISAVSLQNEPDLTTKYRSCRWTGLQFHDFLKNSLKPVWDQQGIQAKVIAAEQMKWRGDLIKATLKDPATEPILDIIAAHGYWTATPFQLSSAKSSKKPVWQTEENGNFGTGAPADPGIDDGLFWAERLHKWMTIAGISAWNWHWLTTGKSWGKDWGAKIIEIDGDTYSYARRLWTIGNFSRFIRPGYLRIDSTPEPAIGVFTSAYKDPASGNFAIVAINKNSIEQTLNISLNNLTTSSVTPYVTTDALNLEAFSSIAVNGNVFTAVLPAKSVTTFTGLTLTGTDAVPPAPPAVSSQ